MVSHAQNSNPGTVPDPSDTLAPGCLSAIGTALVADPTAGVRIIAQDGLILYMNPQAARMFHGPDATPAELIGKNYNDLRPPAWADERMAVIQRVISSGRPALVRVIWEGRQVLNWIHPVQACGEPGEEPLETGEDTPVHAIIVSRYGPLDEETRRGDGFDFIEAEIVDLGPLDVLTPRELEVLALLGQGLSVRETAKTLFRSEKTIETHRSSIGRKLGVNDRVKLAAIALQAGLTLADAQRARSGRE